MNLYFTMSAFFLSIYSKDKNNLVFILESYVPKFIMSKIYIIMVKDKELTPIESIDRSEKESLVRECRSTGIFFTNERLIESAKILHTLKFINENI